MQQKAQFSKSKVPCLVRHRGGVYYVSAKVRGKLIRQSLGTDDYGTAKIRLPAALAEIRGSQNAATAGTLAQSIHVEANREDPTITASTRHYYKQIATSLIRTGEALPDNPMPKLLTKIKLADLRALMDRYGTTFAATRYNGGLALLRRVYARAVEAEQVVANLPDQLKRIQPKPSKYDLPTAATLAAIVADILAQRKSHSKAAAMAVELLANTGLRISEAQSLQWRDIKPDHLTVRTAKNDGVRRVPLIPAAKDLFARMRVAGPPTGDDDPVLVLRSPRIALAGACERLSLAHLRIHDLRHIFATRCIEANVDLPTLASWLGHKDRGVLAAKTYGHLCQAHSDAQASRVVV
jgi:integrase